MADEVTEETRALAVRPDQEEPPRMPGGKYVVGGKPQAVVPVDFDGAWRIANIVFKARMAPKGFNSAEMCMVAILHGLEVGLTPMNALQSIAVINGRPTIWGDGALGLIEASGLLEDKDEHFEGDGEAFKAVCILKRKGRGKPVRIEFTWAMAKKAGLLSKEGPWQAYPQRMFQMRARSWAMRDGFSDVLKGLHIREEVEDYVEAPSIAPSDSPVDPSEPPLPPSAQIAKAEPAPIPAEGAMTMEGGYGFAEEVKESAAAAKAFPGDTPVEQTADPLDIPEALRRSRPVVMTDGECDWIEGLKGAFSGCEDIGSLEAELERLVFPYNSKVGKIAWDTANDLYLAEATRIARDAT